MKAKDQTTLYAEAVAYSQGRSKQISPAAVDAVLNVLRACRASHLELQQVITLIATQDEPLPALDRTLGRRMN